MNLPGPFLNLQTRLITVFQCNCYITISRQECSYACIRPLLLLKNCIDTGKMMPVCDMLSYILCIRFWVYYYTFRFVAISLRLAEPNESIGTNVPLLMPDTHCWCFIIRPPVYGSNGRTYKMLVMFFFLFLPRVLGVPSTDRPETLPHGRNLA